jgi:hypothetical protein
MDADAINTLLFPPFPLLQWDEYDWVGEITLPSWSGFQTRRGFYGSISSERPSEGNVRLYVGVDDSESRTPPTREQVAAYQYLLDNEPSVAASVLRAIFEKYPEEKEAYLDSFDEGEVDLPDIREPGELRSLIGLSNVHILFTTHKGTAYIGFEFGCVWEAEHGLGVMTHQGRVVEVGNADVSFLTWIADRDAKARQ